MTDLLLGILIFLVLGVLVFLIVLAKRRSVAGGVEVSALRDRLEAEQAARVQAQTRLEAERENLEEQKRLLDEAERKLRDAFAALSAEALKESRQEFLSTAGEKLRPIEKALEEYQKRLGEIEKAREGAYSGLREYLDALRESQQSLQKEAHTLSTALKSPTVRGRWGEVTLRRVVELAGMSRHCDFDEQASMNTEEGRLRPDLVVHLPGNRLIVVDSKVPGDAYFEALEAKSEAERRGAMARHAQAVSERMRQLGQKAYASHLEKAPDFVVLFLSPESFFSAALEQAPGLIEDGMKNGVVFATPTTLLALLRAVAYGWQQQQVAENAQKIAQTGRELYDRIRVFAEKFRDVGSGLRSAAKAYDAAVGSYQSRLEPKARDLAQLGASDGQELPDVEPVEGPVRSLPPADESGADSAGGSGAQRKG